MSEKIKKELKVHAIFENISEKYDMMNDFISFGLHRIWKLHLTKEISGHKTGTILDVCCGTGDLALLLAKQNEKAKITGIDFSNNMLKIAEKRKRKRGLHNVKFIQGDAMQLPFMDDTFDCAVISFGLRNVTDYKKVLLEMKRVIRPEGMLYCLDSSYPENKRFKPWFKLYFKYIMPYIGRIFAGKGTEYQWLNDSTEQFLTKVQLSSLFKQCGLHNVGYYRHFLGTAACHRGTK